MPSYHLLLNCHYNATWRPKYVNQHIKLNLNQTLPVISIFSPKWFKILFKK